MPYQNHIEVTPQLNSAGRLNSILIATKGVVMLPLPHKLPPPPPIALPPSRSNSLPASLVPPPQLGTLKRSPSTPAAGTRGGLESLTGLGLTSNQPPCQQAAAMAADFRSKGGAPAAFPSSSICDPSRRHDENYEGPTRSCDDRQVESTPPSRSFPDCV